LKSFVTDVFFDLDHTLWDFEKNSALTFKQILNENKINIKLEDFLEVYILKNFEFWKLFQQEKITKEKLRYLRLKDTFDYLNYKVENELIHKLADDYIEHLPKYNHLIKNTLEILNYLKPKYKLHIITSGFEVVQRAKLINSNIEHFFIHIINSDMAGVKKPHPAIFELALSKANVNPKNTVMIGDSLEADIIGAKSVGMNTIFFDIHKNFVHNGVVVNDLLEIKSYL
jgi:putative hydrolase of the HAD superfamily